MAEALIEQWRLAVLRVELDLHEPVPEVLVQLSTRPHGTPRLLGSWRYPLGAFGITEDRDPPRSLLVPADLPGRVGTALRGALDSEPALWLRLVPPYGYLGAVPWETALAASGLPVLRVPDRLPAAVDPGSVFTMVVAVCARSGSTWAPVHVRGLLDGLRALPTPLDVHVFADAATVAQFSRAVEPAQGWQHVHDPSVARRAAQARSIAFYDDDRARLRAPFTDGRVWADWIAGGLAGRAARAVHVVADAGWDGDRPVLLVTPDPMDTVDDSTRATVTAEQLGGLTDQVGAATLSIASPPTTQADAATRVIADLLGRTRRGPTLYSSIADDPTAAALARAYRALSAPGAGIPHDSSLFAYLQPEHVRDADYPTPDDGSTSGGDSGSSTPDPLGSYYATTEAVPLWAAASQRYVEAGMTALRASADDSGFAVKRAYDKGSAGALADIQALLARHLGES